MLTVGLVAIASIGKFGGAFIGAELSGLNGREALAVGCGMNARGSTEVIVATIGLTMGALSQNLYTMIVTMAVITTMAMPPMLRWALQRLPISDEEKKRLEKEDIDSKGFVSRLAEQPLEFHPGTHWHYTISTDICGRLVEILSGQRFDDFADRLVRCVLIHVRSP